MNTLFGVALLGGWQAGLTGWALAGYVSYIVGIIGVIGIIRVWMKRRFKTDWDISERHKRIRPLVILLGFFVLNWWAIRGWGSADLVKLYTIFCGWLIGFLMITLWFKISGHVGIVTLATGLIIRWFGMSWWPISLIVPLVAWARVTTKKHTALEVIAGIIYSSLILFASKILGY